MTATTTTTWEAVIGLEVHVELATATKLFCSCKNEFGAEPNTNVCPVCLGLPGSLPVLGERAVEFALRVGEALQCTVPDRSLFHRKNYFYPDMPKDYQISQYDEPICANGSLRPQGAETLGTKVEVKNMNSIRSVGRALEYEIERQRALLDAGERVMQETRHWDEDAGITHTMRTKEEADDYRYFPEP